MQKTICNIGDFSILTDQNQSSLSTMEIGVAIGMHQIACSLGEVSVLTHQTSLFGSNGNLYIECNLGYISILFDQTNLVRCKGNLFAIGMHQIACNPD